MSKDVPPAVEWLGMGMDMGWEAFYILFSTLLTNLPS